jgi:ABC-type branched-subunit amino acid transport system substrate-binding protein
VLKPGDRVDDYVIVAPLGEGGMGQVYRARDEQLQRDVALKVLRLQGGDPTSRILREARASRILREARAAAGLDHPNVVSIFAVGEVDGTPYLAMELVNGKSLRHHIREGTTPVDARLKWLEDVGNVLAAAHAKGFVHRDIKPENVMIRDDGIVKVLDFGIAQRAHPDLAPMSTQEALVISTMSTHGGAPGTPIYMAPEQMRGEPLDGRVDQFAWGVLAYELLSGELPWGKDVDALKLLATLLSKDPEPLAARAPDVPPRVASCVMRALAKSAGERFASMSDLLRAFRGERVPPAKKEEPPPQPPAKAARSKRPWIATALVLATGAAALAIGHARRASGQCTSNRECPARSICRTTCVKLDSEDCTALAEEADFRADDTLWVGTMFPLKGDDAAAFGTSNAQAVELARRDFTAMRGGLSTRPIGLVSCDESVDAARAARHLVNDVHVPAIIGFRTASELIDLAGSTFIPNDVLMMASLTTSPLIGTIPHRPGQPHLVWRTTWNSVQTAAALAAVVKNILEPELKGPIRVALVRTKAARLSVFSDTLFKELIFNGKSALANGTDYRELVFEEEPARAEVDYATIATQLLAFAPHIVVYVGPDALVRGVIEPVEQRWPQASAHRPRWLAISPMAPPVFDLVAKDPTRRTRFLGVGEVSTTQNNARFVMHYNEVFGEHVVRAFAPNTSYDAFYLVAYASLAVGDQPVTGRSLAKAFGRLVPPGRPIDVGIADIFPAFTALRRGENIDFTGAAGQLDFDLTTGDAPFDQSILCVGLDEAGHPTNVESGVVYEAATRTLKGTLRCP